MDWKNQLTRTHYLVLFILLITIGVGTASINSAYAVEFISKFGSHCILPSTSGCVDPDGAGPLEIGDGEFNDPVGISVDNTGDIYVADVFNNRIQKFDSNFGFLLKLDACCFNEGQFIRPSGITVDSSDNIYVAENNNHRVQKFDSDGNFLLMWGWGVNSGSAAFETCMSNCQGGISGSGDGQFDDPRGLALDSSGNIFVVDSENDRVQKFDSAGNFVSKFGSFCNMDKNGDGILGDPSPECVDPDDEGPLDVGDSQFWFPQDIALDGSNNIYVLDSNNHRIQKFDSNGNFQSDIGGGRCVIETGDDCEDLDDSGPLELGDLQFNGPRGMAVSSSGTIYVADSQNNRIQKFDSIGGFEKFGSFCRVDLNMDGTPDDPGPECIDPDGEGPLEAGDGQFSSPEGIAIDISGNIYVTEIGNDRVQKFGIPQCNPPNSDDWSITESCEISSDIIAPASVIIQNNSVVTINPGGSLTVTSGENIIVVDGSGLKLLQGSTLNVLS